MANSTEIGQVLSSAILLNGERQLLRARGGATQNQGEQPPPAQPALAALETENKAVANVLFAMLDERIQSSTEDAADTVSAEQRPTVDDGKQGAARLNARYSENAPLSPFETARPEIVPGTTIPLPLQMAAPELQTFMQRLAAITASADARRGVASASSPISTAGMGSIAASAAVGLIAVATAIWLMTMLAGWLLA